MQPRILFTSASGFVSGAIRWITGSAVSHVGVQIGAEIVHADRGGVQIDDLAGFLKGGRTLRHVYELRQEIACDASEVFAYAKKDGDGKPLAGYDYDGMIWNVVPILSWRWLKIRLGNPLADKNEFWCSEFAVTSLRKASSDMIPEFKGLNAEVVTPGGLLRVVSRSKSFFKVVDKKAPKA
ncbi:MAG: hypothetical protein IT371_30750 [Deltaproteobacteria bacterium]|nr:hypothetical protein [Deltaproteobacteria bacterium]